MLSLKLQVKKMPTTLEWSYDGASFLRCRGIDMASISVAPSKLRHRRQQKKELYNDLVVPAAL